MKAFLSLILLFPVLSRATELNLNTQDSLLLLEATTLPLVQSQTVVEGGKEFNLQTRSLVSEDGLLGFTCRQKYFAGQMVATNCMAAIDPKANIHDGNRLQKGVGGLLRASIQSIGDLPKFQQALQTIGACRPDIATRLYASQERREIILPDGRKLFYPLLKANCLGNSGRLTQLVVDLVPRAE